MPAGFWIRVGAALLDVIIIGIPLAIISFILTGGEGQEYVTNILSFLYTLLLPVFWRGYTVGKRICGIRIQRYVEGTPPGIGTMLMRNVVSGIVYALTIGIASIISLVMVAAREDKRAIHDFIAGTQVVHD
jgi:uncharacterized RDD family membrane protein YckC